MSPLASATCRQRILHDDEWKLRMGKMRMVGLDKKTVIMSVGGALGPQARNMLTETRAVVRLYLVQVIDITPGL